MAPTQPLNTMTYFPHHSRLRPAAVLATAPGFVRPTLKRDILWNQPVFQAPALPNSFAPARPDWGQTPGFAKRNNGAVFEPIPFTAQRLTLRRARA